MSRSCKNLYLWKVLSFDPLIAWEPYFDHWKEREYILKKENFFCKAEFLSTWCLDGFKFWDSGKGNSYRLFISKCWSHAVRLTKLKICVGHSARVAVYNYYSNDLPALHRVKHVVLVLSSQSNVSHGFKIYHSLKKCCSLYDVKRNVWR